MDVEGSSLGVVRCSSSMDWIPMRPVAVIGSFRRIHCEVAVTAANSRRPQALNCVAKDIEKAGDSEREAGKRELDMFLSDFYENDKLGSMVSLDSLQIDFDYLVPGGVQACKLALEHLAWQSVILTTAGHKVTGACVCMYIDI